MKKTKWNLIVRGEVLEGFSVDEVKGAFVRLTRLSPQRVERLFRDGAALCKRNLDEKQARLQLEMFRRKGLVCYLKEAGGGQTRARSGGKGDTRGGEKPSAAAASREKRPQLADKRVVRLPFLFFGTAKEYFQIWWVNQLLTLLTVGIYLPWARVKTLGYLYSKTRLDGAGFSFLAQPPDLLKPYLIAVTALLGVCLAAWFHPSFAVFLLVTLVILFPWFKLWSLRFKARNCAWRDVRFEFSGDLQGAYSAYLLWPLLVLLSGGLLYPQMVYQQKRYLYGGLRYGDAPFRLALKVGALWRLHLLVIGLVVAAALTAQLVVIVAPRLVLPWIGVCAILIGAFVAVRQGNLVHNALGVAQYRFRRNFTLPSWLGLQLGNVLAILFSLGLLIPWVRIRSIRYRLQRTSLVAVRETGQVAASRGGGYRYGEVCRELAEGKPVFPSAAC